MHFPDESARVEDIRTSLHPLNSAWPGFFCVLIITRAADVHAHTVTSSKNLYRGWVVGSPRNTMQANIGGIQASIPYLQNPHL